MASISDPNSFDLSTAVPVDGSAPASSFAALSAPGGFDLSTAKPVEEAKKADKDSPAEPDTDWGRQIALAGRAAATGVTGALTLPASVITGMINAPRRFSNAYKGTHLKMVPSPTDALTQGLTAAGAPVAQTSGEQLASAGISGLTGGLTGAGAISGIPAAIRAGSAGATAGLSQEGARQIGLPPWLQVTAGLLGSQTPAMGESFVRTIGDISAPLTAAGQQRAAGTLLNAQAHNPGQAQLNLAGAQPTVPNSLPTAGAASQDVGLLGLDKAMHGRSTAAFGERLSDQNAARQAELTNIGGTSNDLRDAIAARAQTTAPLYAQAATQSAPIDSEMIALMQRPAMQSAITKAKEMAENSGRPFGLSSTAPGRPMALSGADLQGMKLALDDMKSTGFSQGIGAHQQRALQSTSDALTNWMAKNVPAQREADAAFQNMSGPVNRMQTVQALQQKASTTAADMRTGQYFLSPASYSRALDDVLADSRNGLGSTDITRLEAIRKDLQNSQAIAGPLLKAPGSDTFANLSLNQNISGIGRLLMKPLDPIYKMGGADSAVNDLLTQAMLDPKSAQGLMQKAGVPRSTLNFRPFDLGTLGGLLGTSP